MKVVQLHGQHGVGKTALAHQIVKNATGTLPGRFEQTAIDSCWQETWASIIARIAKALIGRQALQSATVEMLENAILNAAKRNDCLLVLDNIEQYQMDNVQQFARLWLQCEHNSVLLMTGVEPIEIENQRAICYPISGLSGSGFLKRFGSSSRDTVWRRIAGSARKQYLPEFLWIFGMFDGWLLISGRASRYRCMDPKRKLRSDSFC